MTASGIISQDEERQQYQQLEVRWRKTSVQWQKLQKEPEALIQQMQLQQQKRQWERQILMRAVFRQTVTALSAGTENLIQTGITPLQEGNT